MDSVVGWIEAIAETYHNKMTVVMDFALLYPSYELICRRRFLVLD
ncbi:hypothetical protein CRENPOLYSF2_400004 [Crenothrix polyspora]|uniref:Uncharacterized protein n=1 Tax=Crenothrix polyspora TaxID=360316 RepID=A0A1R4HE11_9GAMM|nr:hypothetical protein CRENPOLYSF2_400004 [Crenothrix polyspora]